MSKDHMTSLYTMPCSFPQPSMPAINRETTWQRGQRKIPYIHAQNLDVPQQPESFAEKPIKNDQLG